jgi:hypothetical protein
MTSTLDIASDIGARYRAACDRLSLPVWRPGMLSTHSARFLKYDLGVSHAGPNDEEEPDFSDPATIGCLFAAVREAWGSQKLHSEYSDDPEDCPWRVRLNVEYVGTGTTEVEAMVSALEAASRRN